MKLEEFEMRERLAAEDLAWHPVWAPFRAGDRARVLGWGVAPERLDAELERYAYCGPDPLFPVLESEAMPGRADLVVAGSLQFSGGAVLSSAYRIAPHVVGLFVKGREWVFNRFLPERAERAGRELAAALGLPTDAIFPMHFRGRLPGFDARFER